MFPMRGDSPDRAAIGPSPSRPRLPEIQNPENARFDRFHAGGRDLADVGLEAFFRNRADLVCHGHYGPASALDRNQ